MTCVSDIDDGGIDSTTRSDLPTSITQSRARAVTSESATRAYDRIGAIAGRVAHARSSTWSSTSTIAGIRCEPRSASRDSLHYLLTHARLQCVSSRDATGARASSTRRSLQSVRCRAACRRRRAARHRAVLWTTSTTRSTHLTRRLDKARAVKQGMMQELLTGRTRLPVEEAAS